MSTKEESEISLGAEELEVLRRRIEDLDNEIGEIGNRVERFQPVDDRTIGQNLKELHAEIKEKTTLLEGKVCDYLQNNTEIIDQWLSPHEYRCNCIIKQREELEGVDDNKANIRKELAQEILKNLKKIRRGKSFHFSINQFYLKEYYLNLLIDGLPNQEKVDRDNTFEKFIGVWIGAQNNHPTMRFEVIDGIPWGEINGYEIKKALVEGNFLKFNYEYRDWNERTFYVDVVLVLSKDSKFLAGTTILRDNVAIKTYPFLKRKESILKNEKQHK